jgi:hypothetical protein
MEERKMKHINNKGSRPSVITEARVLARNTLRSFVVNKEAVGQVFLLVLRFYPLNIIPLWFSLLASHLGEEQKARWWKQFKGTVLPRRFENHNF